MRFYFCDLEINDDYLEMLLVCSLHYIRLSHFYDNRDCPIARSKTAVTLFANLSHPAESETASMTKWIFILRSPPYAALQKMSTNLTWKVLMFPYLIFANSQTKKINFTFHSQPTLVIQPKIK